MVLNDLHISTHPLITDRFSPRAFSSKPVDEEKILSLFEAARWASSSRNEQPWRFIYASKDNKEEYDAMFECLGEWNQHWAKTAPVLILTIAKSNFSHNGLPNRHAWYDTGLSVGNMALQATYMGLHIHQMGGFSKTKAIEKLAIPDGFEPVTMIALGYLGKPEILEEEYRELEYKERTRKSIDKIVYKGKWN